MPEKGAIVEVELGIQGQEAAWGDGQGIYFGQGTVLGGEESIEVGHHLGGGADKGLGEAQGVGQAPAEEGREAQEGVDGGAVNPLRVFSRYLLDVHAPGIRGDEDRGTGGAVDGE